MARKTAGIHDEKVEFINNTEGYLGVVTYAPNGDEKPIAVEPSGTVWLSEAEQELTAKAPKNAADNPFIEQKVAIVDPDTGDTTGYRTIIPLTLQDEARPTPSARARQVARATGEANPARGDAPDGSHDHREEVGTPSAQAPAARRRRRSGTAKGATATK